MSIQNSLWRIGIDIHSSRHTCTTRCARGVSEQFCKRIAAPSLLVGPFWVAGPVVSLFVVLRLCVVPPFQSPCI